MADAILPHPINPNFMLNNPPVSIFIYYEGFFDFWQAMSIKSLWRTYTI
mgnify:CR=1 FL=1